MNPAPTPDLTPSDALRRLLEGNRRYREGASRHPRQDPARRAGLRGEQHPFAAVLGCSDSRVPPQLVFDQGLGDLFTVRVAGHVVDDAAGSVAASLAYAVEQLRVPLVLVLGHSGCGAVGATAAALDRGEACDDALGRAICPAVRAAAGEGSARIDAAVRIHVERTVRLLRHHPVLEPRLRAGELALAGAVYDLTSGAVEIVADPAGAAPREPGHEPSAAVAASESTKGTTWRTPEPDPKAIRGDRR